MNMLEICLYTQTFVDGVNLLQEESFSRGRDGAYVAKRSCRYCDLLRYYSKTKGGNKMPIKIMRPIRDW